MPLTSTAEAAAASSGGGCGLHAQLFELAAQLLHFFFLAASLERRASAGSFRRLPSDLGGDAGDVEVAAESSERADAADGFDAAHAGGDGAFADDFDEADFAGGGGVRAAAELGGEVADADDADLVAVLFAEERHGVELVDGDVDGHVDEGFDGGVGEDLRG